MKKLKNKATPLLKQIIRVFILCNLILFYASCKEESHYVKKEYYTTGELLSETSYLKEDSLRDGLYKEFYKNGNLKQSTSFKKSIQTDSAMLYFATGELRLKEVLKADTILTSYYYKNGNLSALVKSLNREIPIEIGWTQNFNKKGVFSDSLEYFNINNKSELNQLISYNDDGGLNLNNSFFYRMKVSKIKDVDKHQLKVSYFPSVKESTVYMIISKKINDDFSNLKSVKLDTLLLENNILTANLKKPYQNLKGFFYEYNAKVKHAVGKDSVRMTIHEKKTYFNEHIKVTDTIEQPTLPLE